MIRILIFAGIQEKLQTNMITAPFEQATVRELKNYLLQEYPALEREWSQALLAVNQEFVSEEQWIKSTDEVAIIPPVSGG